MKVLVPVDKKKWCVHALRFAQKHFGGKDNEIVILWVDEPVPDVEAVVLGAQRVEEILAEDGRDALAIARAILAPSGAAVTEMVRDGDRAHVVAQVADEIGADLILKGAHPSSKVTDIMFGSTANKLVELSDRPLLLVRGLPKAWIEQERPSIGLIASAAGPEAPAVRFALETGERVFPKHALYYLLAVAPKDQAGQTEAGLAAAAARLSETGYEVKTRLLEGSLSHAAELVAGYANGKHFDLLVTGPRNCGPIERALLGYQTVDVLSRTDMPIVIVH